MTKYTVIYREAGESSPKRVVLKGADESSLRRECEAKGWQVLLVRHAKWMGYGRRFKWVSLRGYEIQLPFPLGVWTAELGAFCEVLCTLSKAGVPLLQIIDICIQDADNAWFRKRLQIVRERLQRGDGLSAAVEDPRCVKAFPPVLRKRIRIEESNGRLGDALARFKLAIQFDKARREAMNFLVNAAIGWAVAVLGLCFVDAVFSSLINSGIVGTVTHGRLPLNMLIQNHFCNHPIRIVCFSLMIGAVGVMLWVGIKCFVNRIAHNLLRCERADELRRQNQKKTLVCRKCRVKFGLNRLIRAKGRCPKCGAVIPFSDYCTCWPETRWWRLYFAAPMKLRNMVDAIAMFTVGGLLSIAYFLYASEIGIASGTVLLVCTCALSWFVLRRAFTGGVFFDVLCLLLSAACIWVAFVLGPCSGHLAAWMIFGWIGMLSGFAAFRLVIPADRRWVRMCREEGSAFAVARSSGQDVSSLRRLTYPLNVVAIARLAFTVCFVGPMLLYWAHFLVQVSPVNQLCSHQVRLVRLDGELRDCDILNCWKDNSAGILIATNCMTETIQKLDRGIVIVEKIRDLTVELTQNLSVRQTKTTAIEDKIFELAKCLDSQEQVQAKQTMVLMWGLASHHGREFWMAFGVQLRRLKKTLDHLATWNDAGRRAEMRMEFGVDSDEVAFDKLKEELAALGEPLRQARKIVGHFALWNDDERRGELRAVFGVDTDEALAAKFAEELADFDKLSRRAKEADAK